jgi:hypothetical protein
LLTPKPGTQGGKVIDLAPHLHRHFVLGIVGARKPHACIAAARPSLPLSPSVEQHYGVAAHGHLSERSASSKPPDRCPGFITLVFTKFRAGDQQQSRGDGALVAMLAIINAELRH